jgi:threonine-phosphate decarboxylase
MLLVVCNPNNPTGVLVDRENLARQAELAKRNRGWLLVDESFQDFIENPPTMVSELNSHLLVVRSLTKFFAMPGLRLGYIVASREIATSLERQRPGWNVNSLALSAGATALKQRCYNQKIREIVDEARIELYQRLASQPGIKPYPSTTNFILFRIEGSGDLVRFLLGKRVLIRSCSNFRGLGQGWYRCGVRTPAENDRLMDALKLYLEGQI